MSGLGPAGTQPLSGDIFCSHGASSVSAPCSVPVTPQSCVTAMLSRACTQKLSGADVQPRLSACGSAVVLLCRSLVSIKSSSRARQARMVQAHTPSLSPSLSPWLTGTQGTWGPSVLPGTTVGPACAALLLAHGYTEPWCLVTCPSQHPWRAQTDRQTDRGFQGRSRTHTLGWEGVFGGRD